MVLWAMGKGRGCVCWATQTHNTPFEGVRLIPVAHRATKVWACLRMICLLSSATGILVRKCSIKSWGVIAARFHFSLFTRSSSICYRTKKGRKGSKREMCGQFPLLNSKIGSIYWDRSFIMVRLMNKNCTLAKQSSGHNTTIPRTERCKQERCLSTQKLHILFPPPFSKCHHHHPAALNQKELH